MIWRWIIGLLGRWAIIRPEVPALGERLRFCPIYVFIWLLAICMFNVVFATDWQYFLLVCLFLL